MPRWWSGLDPMIEECVPMNIVFFCQSCGARFEVPPTSAGKKGRCKSCGQMMTVPKAQELASMVAMPALAMAAVGAGASAGARVGATDVKSGNSLGWLAAANSNVALAPITEEKMPAFGARRQVKPQYDDDLGDSKPYQISAPIRPGAARSSGRGPSGATILWKKNLGGLQKLFRKLNETAYLISVPFLLVILLGAIVQSRPLALVGGTAVVLLNIGRIVAGVANLAVVPFREGIFQGIMFLIPPLTFFYLSSHWNKVKKPTMRIVGPFVTICLVFAAFLLIPSLRKDGKMVSVKNVKDELRNEAKSLKGEMIGEVKKAKSVDLGSLEKQAEDKLRDAAGQINSIGQPGGPGPTAKP
jgi:hypothetical protein